MPQLKLASDETFGARLARLRKERGLTQVELGEKVGIIQVLVTDYERGRLRLNAEMICRFAQALGVSADELLGLRRTAATEGAGSEALPLRLVRRIKKIELLPTGQQKTLLQTIDVFLHSAGIDG